MANSPEAMRAAQNMQRQQQAMNQQRNAQQGMQRQNMGRQQSRIRTAAQRFGRRQPRVSGR